MVTIKEIEKKLGQTTFIEHMTELQQAELWTFIQWLTQELIGGGKKGKTSLIPQDSKTEGKSEE